MAHALRVRLFMSRERSIALSGVPERLRNLSEREFYNTAIELRVEAPASLTPPIRCPHIH